MNPTWWSRTQKQSHFQEGRDITAYFLLRKAKTCTMFSVCGKIHAQVKKLHLKILACIVFDATSILEGGKVTCVYTHCSSKVVKSSNLRSCRCILLAVCFLSPFVFAYTVFLFCLIISAQNNYHMLFQNCLRSFLCRFCRTFVSKLFHV